VVLVEDLLAALEVLVLAALLLPGDTHQPVDVVARDGGLGGDRRHRLQPLELLLGLLLDLGRQARLLDLLLELGELVGLVVLAAELLVDRLDLLVQVVLLLSTLHLLLDLNVDPLVDVDLLDLDVEQVVQPLQPLVRVQQLQQRLLLRRAHHQVGRQLVGEVVGILGLDGRDQALERQVVRHLGVLLEDAQHLGDVRLQLIVQRIGDLEGLGLADQRALFLDELDHAAALDALDHHLDVAVGELQVLHHLGYDADLVHVLAQRIVDLGVLLRHQEDVALGRAQAALESAHRALAADDERGHHVGEDHHVAQRHQG
jgi:hypothetical protein